MPQHIDKKQRDKRFKKGAFKRTLKLFHHQLNEGPEESGKYPFSNYGKPQFFKTFNLFLRLKGLKKVEKYHTG